MATHLTHLVNDSREIMSCQILKAPLPKFTFAWVQIDMRAAIRIAARVAKVNVKPGAPQDKGKPLLRPTTHPIARVGQDSVLKNDGRAAGIWNAMNSEQETVVCLGD